MTADLNWARTLASRSRSSAVVREQAIGVLSGTLDHRHRARQESHGHQHEPARQRARELVDTPGFVKAQRQRKKVEALFADLKNQIGLRRLRLRRLKFVREQFYLAAAAQNIKRLVRFLSQVPSPTLTAIA